MLTAVCMYVLEVLFCGSGIGLMNKCRFALMLSHLPFDTFTSCMLLMYSSVSRLVAFEPSPSGGWMLRTNLTKSSVLIVRSSSHMAHHMPIHVSPSVRHRRNTLSASGNLKWNDCPATARTHEMIYLCGVELPPFLPLHHLHSACTTWNYLT
jgi:hypothetical protein